MRGEQIVPVVDLVDVDLAQLLHVLEHLMRQVHGFASVFERLGVVLVLTQNGAKLELELALVVHSPVPLRNALALVELRLADERNALLQVENALIKHT